MRAMRRVGNAARAAGRWAFLGFAIALGIPASDLFGYDTFGDGYGSKWDDPNFGTGAVVTWSFVTPGTGLSSHPAVAHLSGTNTLGGGDPAWDIRYKIDAQFGAGAFDAAVRRAMNTWARVANLSFVQVADSGGLFAGSTTPDIRIAGYHFPVGDNSGGAAWGPPGDDLQFPDALSGDLALNDRNRFTIASGDDGTPIPTDQGVYLNDVEGLILHELGHALGLGHSDVITGVMCGYIYPGDVWDGSQCDYTHVNHILHPDDIAGMREIYGPAAIPVPISPVAGPLLGLLLAAFGARAASRRAV
jgi:hypothetical protein